MFNVVAISAERNSPLVINPASIFRLLQTTRICPLYEGELQEDPRALQQLLLLLRMTIPARHMEGNKGGLRQCLQQHLLLLYLEKREKSHLHQKDSGLPDESKNKIYNKI